LFGILQKLPAEETAKVPAMEAIGKIAVALEDCMNRQASLDKRPRDYMSLVKRLSKYWVVGGGGCFYLYVLLFDAD
jgi:hypothetical protein